MPTAHDLSMLDGDELAARLGESRRELFNLRFQLATGQLDNPARIGQVKRDVARMLTVLRGRHQIATSAWPWVPGRTTKRALNGSF